MLSPTLLTLFFGLSNLLVSIPYALMAFAPRRDLTQRYMKSLWWLLPLIALYLVLVTLILIDSPGLLRYWDDLYAQGGIFGSFVGTLSEVYGLLPQIALLHGWVHIVIGDVFMARWAYFDALERGLPSWMIAVAVLAIGIVGPIGVGVYLVMRWGRTRAMPHAD
jgi:hypothetical protein